MEFQVNTVLKEELAKQGVQESNPYELRQRHVHINALEHVPTTHRFNIPLTFGKKSKTVTSFLQTLPAEVVSIKEQKEAYKQQKYSESQKAQEGVIPGAKIYRNEDGSIKALVLYMLEYIYSIWIPKEKEGYNFAFSVAASEENFLYYFINRCKPTNASASLENFILKSHNWDKIETKKSSYTYHICTKYIDEKILTDFFTNRDKIIESHGIYHSIRYMREERYLVTKTGSRKEIVDAVSEILNYASKDCRMYKISDEEQLDLGSSCTKYFQVLRSTGHKTAKIEELLRKHMSHIPLHDELFKTVKSPDSANLGAIKANSKSLKAIKRDFLRLHSKYTAADKQSGKIAEFSEISNPIKRMSKITTSIENFNGAWPYIAHFPELAKRWESAVTKLNELPEALVQTCHDLKGSFYTPIEGSYATAGYDNMLTVFCKKEPLMLELYAKYMEELESKEENYNLTGFFYEPHTAAFITEDPKLRLMVPWKKLDLESLLIRFTVNEVAKRGNQDCSTLEDYVTDLEEKLYKPLGRNTGEIIPILIKEPVVKQINGVDIVIEEFREPKKFRLYYNKTTGNRLSYYSKQPNSMVINFILGKYLCRSIVLILKDKKLEVVETQRNTRGDIHALDYDDKTKANKPFEIDLLPDLLG